MLYVDESGTWSRRGTLALCLVPLFIAVLIAQVWVGMWVAKSADHLWGLAPGLLAWIAPIATLFVDVFDSEHGIERLVTAEKVGFLVGVPALAAILAIGAVGGII